MFRADSINALLPRSGLRYSLRTLRLDRRSLLLTMAILAVATAGAFIVRPARGEISGALIFVLGITLAGTTRGLGAALLAAMTSFLLYNFYFAEPLLTFRLETLSDLTPLVIFNVTAVLSGISAGRLKDEHEAAAVANASLSALLGISRALQMALTVDDVRAVLETPSAQAAGVILLPEAVPEDRATAHGVSVDPQRVDGLPLDRQGQITIRVRAGGRAVELAVDAKKTGKDGEGTFGRALANLVALALERAELSLKVAEAEATARTESLKSALLSSVSHDLRTPLTIIRASASSLIDYGDQLEPPVAQSLLHSILGETDRLNRFTANLLEMTRIEAGQNTSSWQILSVSDIVTAAIRRVRPKAGNRIIERMDADDCFVLADAVLFELVLVNVLENAVLYSPDRTRIAVDFDRSLGRCVLTIARIFDRFYRGQAVEPNARGSGLGLAIARGFVRACGGTIHAETPGIGRAGCRIVISLPLAHMQPH